MCNCKCNDGNAESCSGCTPDGLCTCKGTKENTDANTESSERKLDVESEK